MAHRRPPTRLYLHDGATPNCWLGLYMLRPPPVLPIPLEPTFACHCHRYGQRWSSTLARRVCLSRWRSTLARCLASERAMATVCFRVTYSISYEDSGHYPRPAFELRGVSAMRPSRVTADGGHVLLSSDVLPTSRLSSNTSPTSGAFSDVGYQDVVLHRRRWLPLAFFFEPRVTSATKLLCGTAEEDHVPLPSDVVHKQQLYQQRGVSRCTTHVCYVRPLATGCISYKSTRRSWLLISRFKQCRTFAVWPRSRVHFYPLLSGNVHGYEIDFAPRRINGQPS